MMFRTLKKHIPQIMTIINNNYSEQISSQQVNKFSLNAPAHLIHEKVVHTFDETHQDTIFNITPTSCRKYLPAILSSEIPSILLKPCRKFRENRLNKEQFITYFRRSHGMQILQNNIEIKSFWWPFLRSKSKLHHHIRNTIHFIVK